MVTLDRIGEIPFIDRLLRLAERLTGLNRDALFQIYRYGVVGVTSTLVHFGVAVLFFRAVGLSEVPANWCGFTASFAWSYIGNSYWTFAGHGQSLRQTFSRYAGVAALGYAYNAVAIYLTVTWVGLEYEVGLAILIVSWPPLSFLCLKLWAFRTPSPPAEKGGQT